MAPFIQTTKQKDTSSIEKELFQDQYPLSLEEKYQILMEAYQDVRLERNLLRRVLRFYASNSGTNEVEE
jgi:hypothetical protein